MSGKLATIQALFLCLATLSLGLDYAIKTTTKQKLFDWLIAIFVKLDNTRVPLWNRVFTIFLILTLPKWIVHPRLNIGWFIQIFIASFLISTAAFFWGAFLEGNFPLTLSDLAAPPYYIVNIFTHLLTVRIFATFVSRVSNATVLAGTLISVGGFCSMMLLAIGGYFLSIYAMFVTPTFVSTHTFGEHYVVERVRQTAITRIASEGLPYTINAVLSIETKLSLRELIGQIPHILQPKEWGEVVVPITYIFSENGRTDKREGSIAIGVTPTNIMMAAAAAIPFIMVILAVYILFALSIVTRVFRAVGLTAIEAVSNNNCAKNPELYPGRILSGVFGFTAALIYLMCTLWPHS